MRSVKINKFELLTIVRENKEKHIKEAAEAVSDYKAAVLKIVANNLKLAKTGDLEQIAKIRPLLSAPNSYESDYARAIRMLELSVEEVIELEEDVFNQLVLDEWSWKHSFFLSNSSYKGAM